MPRSYFAVVLLRSPALPIEVIERVIDHLQGYPETLLNCALTHRSLYPRAKMVLYVGTIPVTSRKAYDALVRLRFTADGQTFLARTEGLYFSSRVPPLLVGDDNRDVLSRFPVTFAGVAFPNLRILEVEHLYLAADGLWTNSHANTFGRLSKTFFSVTVLKLGGVVFATFRDLIRFICALPRLEDLSLSANLEFRTLTRRIAITPTTGGQLALRRLSLFHHSEFHETWTTILGWLAQTHTVKAQTLRFLSLTSRQILSEFSSRGYYSSSNNLLQHLGPLLQDLELCGIETHSRWESDAFSLKSNTGLKNLHLKAHVFPGQLKRIFGISDTACSGCILGTLTSLDASSLRKLTLAISVDYSVGTIWQGYLAWVKSNTYPLNGSDELMNYAETGLQHMDVDWAPLNNLTAREDFDDLQEVTIEINYKTWNSFRDCVYAKSASYVIQCFHARLEEGMKQLLWQRRGILMIVKTIDDRKFS